MRRQNQDGKRDRQAGCFDDTLACLGHTRADRRRRRADEKNDQGQPTPPPSRREPLHRDVPTSVTFPPAIHHHTYPACRSPPSSMYPIVGFRRLTMDWNVIIAESQLASSRTFEQQDACILHSAFQVFQCPCLGWWCQNQVQPSHHLATATTSFRLATPPPSSGILSACSPVPGPRRLPRRRER